MEISTHNNQDYYNKIIYNRYNKDKNKINNKNVKKVYNYDIKILDKSFIKILVVIYYIIVSKYILSSSGAITFKKIILSLLCSDFSLFSSTVTNTTFFNSII